MFQGDACDLPISPDSQPGPQREPLKVLLVGSRRVIQNTIQVLYVRQFAAVHEWSLPMPTGSPGEFISILARNLRLD